MQRRITVIVSGTIPLAPRVVDNAAAPADGKVLTMNHTRTHPHYAIRPATPHDLEVVLHHRRSMFADMNEGTEAKRDAMIAAARPFVAAALADGSYRGWLIEVDQQVVAGGGVAVVPYQPTPFDYACRRAFVLNLYTEPAFRRQGLARRLMEAMIQWCGLEGFASVSLHASNDGRPLYDALGFERTNEMRLDLK